MNNNLQKTRELMLQTADAFREFLSKISIDRVSPSLLSHINIKYHSANTPLIKLAKIDIRDNQKIAMTPWDSQSLKLIEKAISAHGFNTLDNADHIIVSIPAPSYQRRLEIAKDISRELEKFKISIRNIRRHSILEIKEQNLGETEEYRFKQQIEKISKDFINDISKLAKHKSDKIIGEKGKHN